MAAATRILVQGALAIIMADLFTEIAGTVKIIDNIPSTYSVADATNSALINAWFDALLPGPRGPASDNLLRIGGANDNVGWVALRETIGIKSGGFFPASGVVSNGGDLRLTGDGNSAFTDFDRVFIEPSQDDALPTGLATGTPYWVKTIPNTLDILLATNRANAIAGTFVSYADQGSGTHYVFQRCLPPGGRFFCDGGHWDAVYANYFFENQFTSGVLWTGDPFEPITRISSQGAAVDLNVSRNMFIPGNQPYNTDRARCAVQMIQHHDRRQAPCSGNVVSIDGEGFTSLVTIDPLWGGHCDTTRFDRLASFNCISQIVNNNQQAVAHSVGEQWYYIPQQTDRQGIVNDYQHGGRFDCKHVSIVGDQGATLHRIGTTGGDQDQGSEKYGFVDIDKAVTNGSKLQGRRPLCLLDDQSPRSNYFRIEWGILCHGNEDLSREWYNYDPNDLIVKVATPTAGQIKKVRIDLPGLGAPSQALYGDIAVGLDLMQQLSSGITVGEALTLAANRGSHAMTNFANTKPVAARTYKISSFEDGRYYFMPDCKFIVGQVDQIWLECNKQVGDQWLDSIDNVMASDPSLVITDFDVNARNGTIGLDASGCEAGTSIDLTFDIHPKPGQTLPGILRVTVAARAR